MNEMVTISRGLRCVYLVCSRAFVANSGGAPRATVQGHNNMSAEFLACVRRGPFARPTPDEQIEYLLTRVPRTDTRKNFELHSLEHVLSFQRRVQATKRTFLRRNAETPLGVLLDYWDRTEAQQRASRSKRNSPHHSIRVRILRI